MIYKKGLVKLQSKKKQIHSLDLENTINQAESKDTAELDEAQKARLDDFIMLAEKIVQTREELLN